MKRRFLTVLAVGVVAFSYHLSNKSEEVKYYNDHSIPYEEKAEQYASTEDTNELILVVDNASPTDVLMAEKKGKELNIPLFKVSSTDELPTEVMEQSRRYMYVYGELDSFVESVLMREGFNYASSWH